MRRLAAIEADLGRYTRALDAAIDAVVKDKARPTRAWSMACKTLGDRIQALEDELREAKDAQAKYHNCGLSRVAT